MVRFFGMFKHKQYMKAKPDKYGVSDIFITLCNWVI